MANPFGEVVDDCALDTMVKYCGKPKTQEDRAREAMRTMNDNDKYTTAHSYVNNLKTDYGFGESTMCLIYNATGENIYYTCEKDWYGNIGRTPYPTEIGNGQWAAFQHIHRSKSFAGSQGAVVYRVKNKDGNSRDVMLAWSTPLFSGSNKAYSEMGNPGAFSGENVWKDKEEKLENSRDADVTNRDGLKVEVSTASGDSPVFKAIIKIPFSS